MNMSREIKFRAWDSNNALMMVVHQLNLSPNIEGVIINDLERQKHLTLMQYTGLKDKNGSEIYEGDIVIVEPPIAAPIADWEFVNHTVTFFNGYFYAEHVYKDGSEKKILWGDRLTGSVVIGNIHENPELLP